MLDLVFEEADQVVELTNPKPNGVCVPPALKVWINSSDDNVDELGVLVPSIRLLTVSSRAFTVAGMLVPVSGMSCQKRQHQHHH